MCWHARLHIHFCLWSGLARDAYTSPSLEELPSTKLRQKAHCFPPTWSTFVLDSLWFAYVNKLQMVYCWYIRGIDQTGTLELFEDLRAVQVGVVRLSTRRPVEQAGRFTVALFFPVIETQRVERSSKCKEYKRTIFHGWEWLSRKKGTITKYLHRLRLLNTLDAIFGQWPISQDWLTGLLAGLRHRALCLHFAGWSSECVASWYPVCRSSGALQGCLLGGSDVFQQVGQLGWSNIMIHHAQSKLPFGFIWGFIPPSWTTYLDHFGPFGGRGNPWVPWSKVKQICLHSGSSGEEVSGEAREIVGV